MEHPGISRWTVRSYVNHECRRWGLTCVLRTLTFILPIRTEPSRPRRVHIRNSVELARYGYLVERMRECHATHLKENVRLAEPVTQHAPPATPTYSSSSSRACPNLPRARLDERDEITGSKRLKLGKTQVLPSNTLMSADMNLSSALETPDTDVAVQAYWSDSNGNASQNKWGGPSLERHFESYVRSTVP